MDSAADSNPDAEMVASKLLGFLIKAFIDKVVLPPILLHSPVLYPTLIVTTII